MTLSQRGFLSTAVTVMLTGGSGCTVGKGCMALMWWQVGHPAKGPNSRRPPQPRSTPWSATVGPVKESSEGPSPAPPCPKKPMSNQMSRKELRGTEGGLQELTYRLRNPQMFRVCWTCSQHCW